MTPKEKAENLYDLFVKILPDSGDISKQDIQECAIIAVDEIIKSHIHNEGIRHIKWWQEVKQEIEKL